MRYLLLAFYLCLSSIINIYGQQPLNKSLFEHNVICQQIKLHDDKYYMKVVNNHTYFYDKTNGKYIKEIKGTYPVYDSLVRLATYLIKNGQGIMYNTSKGYSCYTYYNWKNYYQGKVSTTIDTGHTWKEVADFNTLYPNFYHKNEHIFVLDESTILVYGMRSKFVLKDVYTKNVFYSAINLDNIEPSCLPNRDGYVNIDRFKNIEVENFLYLSKDGGNSWIECSTPQWFKIGFKYDTLNDNVPRGSVKANMFNNRLIWFQKVNNVLVITTKEKNREIKSKDNGINWR